MKNNLLLITLSIVFYLNIQGTLNAEYLIQPYKTNYFLIDDFVNPDPNKDFGNTIRNELAKGDELVTKEILTGSMTVIPTKQITYISLTLDAKGINDKGFEKSLNHRRAIHKRDYWMLPDRQTFNVAYSHYTMDETVLRELKPKDVYRRLLISLNSTKEFKDILQFGKIQSEKDSIDCDGKEEIIQFETPDGSGEKTTLREGILKTVIDPSEDLFGESNSPWKTFVSKILTDAETGLLVRYSPTFIHENGEDELLFSAQEYDWDFSNINKNNAKTQLPLEFRSFVGKPAAEWRSKNPGIIKDEEKVPSGYRRVNFIPLSEKEANALLKPIPDNIEILSQPHVDRMLQ